MDFIKLLINTGQKTFRLTKIKIVFLLGFIINSCSFAETPEERPYHHTDNGFRNLPGGIPAEEVSAFYRFRKFFINKVTEDYDIEIPEGHVIPYPAAVELLKSFGTEQEIVTWIGHMTTLIRLDGKVVLTDPFFSDYATPVPPFGPKRSVDPGVKIEDLPPIDIILISHSHYDHLDLPSLEKIPNKDNITVVVPLKLGVYAKDKGFAQVIELDWYEETKVKGIQIIALPVIHWSKRSPFKKNDTLWAGFSIASTQKKIFFSGDLEYGTHYKSLAKYGPFDLAILSISPYKPSFVMKGSHCEPINCLKIGLELKAQNFMPAHWGTIQLGLHPFNEPIEDFKKAAQALNIPPENLKIFKIGETKPLD